MRAPILVLLLATSACATAPAEFLRRPDRPLAWPDESDPRVEYLFSYRDSSDVERSEGFLRWLRRTVLGPDDVTLVRPYGMALLPDETLLIADTDRGVVHALDLVSGRHRQLDGSVAEPVVLPVDVAVAGERFFVTDSFLGCVHIFSADGEHAGAFGTPEEMGRPTGIAYDPTGDRLLVVDTTGGRLLEYGTDGSPGRVLGGRGSDVGQFNYPTNVTVTADGTILVVDSLNFRVQSFTRDLQPLSSFGFAGTGPGTFSKPKGIAVDSDGHVYVVDGLFENLQIFERDGTLLLTLGQSGSGYGEFTLPTGIFIDDRDRIFVADAGNSRIQVFQYLSRSSP